MKKLLIFAFICSVLTANAQNDVVTSLFNDYYDNEEFTKISVSGKMFELFTNIEPGDEDEEEILEAISSLKGLKVIEFMISEKDGIINELVMVVGGHRSFFILSLYGEINLKNIAKLSRSMNVKGMEYLKNLDEDDEPKDK
jgi:hypothetical protein